MSGQLSHSQEIRVIALDFATRNIDYVEVKTLVANAAEIESYIREGTDGR